MFCKLEFQNCVVAFVQTSVFSLGGVDSMIYILIYTFHFVHRYLAKLTSLVKYSFVEFFNKAAHTNQNQESLHSEVKIPGIPDMFFTNIWLYVIFTQYVWMVFINLC